MSLPSTDELESVVVDILSRAKDDGRLSKLTVRIVRQELASHFDVEEAMLGSGVYKDFIKETVHATVSRLENASNQGLESPKREAPEKKDKSDRAVKAGSRPRKSEPRVQLDEERPGGDSASDYDTRPSKKGTLHSKALKPVNATKTSKDPESDAKYKSKAIIESSDDEAAVEPTTRKSPKKVKAPAKEPPLKEKDKQHKAERNASDVEMDSGDEPGPSNSRPKDEAGSSKPSKAAPDPMDSELSSVIDEPPKKRQKKQEKEPALKRQKEEKPKRGKKEVLSRDEETINKLKGIVVACGVRKVWKKEFEGLDKHSQQIKRLHSILGELGMTPRYSLEKAKALRERRELAQELQDVQEFEKATKIRGTGKGQRRSSETRGSADDSDVDADIPARKKNARASITAFLDDQSDEE